MTEAPPLVSLYRNAAGRKEVQGSAPSVLRAFCKAVEFAAWRVQVQPEAGRHQIAQAKGYHIVVNHPVAGPFCLNLRDAYLPAFWRLETSNDRWAFSVAQTPYDPDQIAPARGATFLKVWCPKVLGPGEIRREGFIFMPLQGHLAGRRHFQAMSPLEMIEATLAQDAKRPIWATLHPRETHDVVALAACTSCRNAFPDFS